MHRPGTARQDTENSPCTMLLGRSAGKSKTDTLHIKFAALLKPCCGAAIPAANVVAEGSVETRTHKSGAYVASILLGLRRSYTRPTPTPKSMLAQATASVARPWEPAAVADKVLAAAPHDQVAV